ncbi:hypothetical protein Tco_1199127 [Tanacetum coccineum]
MAPKKTTAPMTDAAIKGLIAQGVADALAEYEATKNSRNEDDNHDSGTSRRTERATRECTYSDFLKCQPLNFKGIEGVVGLIYALTWWNSHVKTVGHDDAYGMTWKTLRKMMTDKYCPRSEIKKMFLEESDEVEKYVRGLPDMIQGSVMASKPKKIKLDDNSRNNQTQRQPFKRKNVARAYTVGLGEKREYGGSL